MFFIAKVFVIITTVVGSLMSSSCKDGSDGFNSEQRMTSIQPGGACEAFSGVKFEVGLDRDRSGTLEDTEVNNTQTKIFCGQRVDGYISRVELIDVSNGDLICPFGGVQMISGLDKDNSKSLQAEEIEFDKKICNGKDGFSSETRIVDIAIGEKGCTFGGKEIQTGLDSNRNGELDDGEVKSFNKICAIQVNENKTLVKNSVINPGEVCQDGGVLTEVGMDDNDNDILELSEIDSSLKRCNKIKLISGLNSRVDTVPATQLQCSFGGFVFKSGLDANFNNVLDFSEVTNSELVCNGVDGYTAMVYPSNYFGDFCSVEGGVKYETGLDLNGNGFLELSEVDKVSFICHGEDGYAFNGFNSLITHYDAGMACGLEGGIYVESGMDLDEDGDLDINEIENSDVICNGLTGLNSLIETYEDLFYCEFGGVVIETGTDYDLDQNLDEEEIQNTTYICR